MKVALLGATGFVGSALLGEALSRGHSVTAIARDASTNWRNPATCAKDLRSAVDVKHRNMKARET